MKTLFVKIALCISLALPFLSIHAREMSQKNYFSEQGETYRAMEEEKKKPETALTPSLSSSSPPTYLQENLCLDVLLVINQKLLGYDSLHLKEEDPAFTALLIKRVFHSIPQATLFNGESLYKYTQLTRQWGLLTSGIKAEIKVDLYGNNDLTSLVHEEETSSLNGNDPINLCFENPEPYHFLSKLTLKVYLQNKTQAENQQKMKHLCDLLCGILETNKTLIIHLGCINPFKTIYRKEEKDQFFPLRFATYISASEKKIFEEKFPGRFIIYPQHSRTSSLKTTGIKTKRPLTERNSA